MCIFKAILKNNDGRLMFRASKFVQGYFGRLRDGSRNAYYEVIEDLDDGSYFDYDMVNNVFYCGKKFANRLGLPQVLPDFPECLKGLKVVSADELSLVVSPKEYTNEISEREVCFYSQKGEELWYLLRYKAIFNSDKVATNLIGKFTNITKKHSDIVLLTEEAQKDSLTGLLNKITTEQQIEKHLTSLHPNQKCALLIIDIDNFKEVNDTFGHLYGDSVLTNLAQYIKQIFRESDVLGRVGGDEFFVFVKNYNTKTIIQKKAEKVCEYFRKKFHFQQEMVEISASIGIAYAPEQASDLEDLYEKADIALYQAKIKGKNRYIEYDDTLFRKKYKGRDSKIHPNEAQKRIGENLMEYVFKLMNSTENFDVGIQASLQFLTDHYNMESAHVFEVSSDENRISCVYEWAQKGASSIKSRFENLDFKEVLKTGIISLSDEYFVVDNISKIKASKIKDIVIENSLKYMLSFGIWEDKKPIAFIGFDDSRKIHTLSPTQLSELGNICRMLGLFLSKHRLKVGK